ncbi:MAG: LytR C-terminal domain-containing protein [Propionibacteriales bacterium]|nr:LytR C-terminal domain-containing protein [Propionibacteriales bacterium]
MSATRPQRNVAAGSLAVTAVIVVVMAVWGFNAATAPIEDDPVAVTPVVDDVVTCGAGQVAIKVEDLRSDQVVVSVYNAGKKKGRATATLNLLENRNFQPGAIGNASDAEVPFAEIHAKATDTTKAKLVALSFGKSAKIVVDDEKDLLGPGVNVIIGDKFRALKAGAPRRIKLPEPVVTCE